MQQLRAYLRRLLLSPAHQNRSRFQHIGQNVHIQSHCEFFCPERISIGNDVYIGPHAWIDAQGSVTIGEGTIIGPRLKIYSASHNYRSEDMLPYDEVVIAGPVVIGVNTWIGGDVLIVPGVSIGEGCVVGAGAVVTRDHPSCTILGGNPARKIGERDPVVYERLKAAGRIFLRTWSGPRILPK
jgi:acetyltransferase-like isoleucine patch superfamily enzyme